MAKSRTTISNGAASNSTANIDWAQALLFFDIGNAAGWLDECVVPIRGITASTIVSVMGTASTNPPEAWYDLLNSAESVGDVEALSSTIITADQPKTIDPLRDAKWLVGKGWQNAISQAGVKAPDKERTDVWTTLTLPKPDMDVLRAVAGL